MPRQIRSDTEPEFIAKPIQRHAEPIGLEMLCIGTGGLHGERIRGVVRQPLKSRTLEIRRVSKPGQGAVVGHSTESIERVPALLP